MFAREQDRLLFALLLVGILIALTFARVDHAALFPPMPEAKRSGETWINR